MTGTDPAEALAVIGRVASIAASGVDQRARAEQVLETLTGIVPHVAAEIVMLNPFDGTSEVLASHGYSPAVLDDLHSPAFHELMALLGLQDSGRPIRMRDLPGDPLDNWAVSDVLIPAGYREGMTMCLRTPDGRVTGVMNISVDSADHPTDLARDAIASLCSTLASMADPAGASHWIRLLLGAGSRAVGLDAAGATVNLPGSDSHPLLAPDSDLLRVAQRSSVRGSWSTFLWQDDDEWLRVRVVPCRGDQHMTAVVSVDSADPAPLSRRELEVLTLAAEGLSNNEIGDALVVSTRTVATHIEHILDKLEAPNRAAAASYALREGLILGRVDAPGRPSPSHSSRTSSVSGG